MKNYAAALLIATTLTSALSFAGAMDLPIDSGSVAIQRAKSTSKSTKSADGYERVSGQEADAMKVGVIQVLTASSDLFCTLNSYDYSGKNTRSETSRYGKDDLDNIINYATSVAKKESEDSLQFLRVRQDGSAVNQVLIKTDASAKSIQEVDIFDYSHVDDAQENVGSMMDPHIVDVPAHDVVTQSYSCKFN